MAFQVLEEYLARLSHNPDAGARIGIDAHGRAHGRFFNSTLGSAFQPIRQVSNGAIAGYEGFARSHAHDGQGLSLWRLLDHVASDSESIELDRLCRTLHAINFFRQTGPGSHDLYLSVHARLLAAVEGDHGKAFRRVLAALGVPHSKVVLQLPPAAAQQRWFLKYVAENYVRNDFRLLVCAVDAAQAHSLIAQVRPEAIKLDGREAPDEQATLKLLASAAAQGVRVIYKRVENVRTLELLKRLASETGAELYLQGFVWDIPQADIGCVTSSVDSGRQDPMYYEAQVGG